MKQCLRHFGQYLQTSLDRWSIQIFLKSHEDLPNLLGLAKIGDGVREAAGFERSFREARALRDRQAGADRLLEWDVHRTD